ncbi:hypothetical protein H6P81_013576 [Aristolochia fimbriata]|uniref:Transmembrane protein n=1 Tax=Aristolochia fimbriata TaxID=158543 RepID=A0AAV7EFB8_ARIFI|nr:hypothetical protein H6P81_013576 [Aristolochia fimbriata]
MAAGSACPPNSFRFNSTLCACNPGYFTEPSGGNCTLFRVSPEEWAFSSGIDYAFKFPTTIFSFDSITKITNSQAVFLEGTFVALLSWLLFCFALRFGKTDGGNSLWFALRWWISRLDFVYSTQHWLDDQKVVRKRKTELGGAFSVASWILFIGLLAALLYQIIAKRKVEVHNVTPTNAPDLNSFVNDMEFNITTISSMSCSHLRGLDTWVTGSPGSVDHRVTPLSTVANYSCHNTSRGPTITLKCNSCKVPLDNNYISWQFVDLPNSPAMAVGFQFNLTAKAHGDNGHIGFVSGTLKNTTNDIERSNTFRGSDVNILQFHLFPRIYHNFHGLKLLQPLFHGFIAGSSILDTSQLRASLQNSEDGLVNTTLHVNFLSDYIVEVNSQNILGPVGFLADLGGLYAFCIALFLYSLLQFEHRIKRLRGEDKVLRDIRSRKRARRRWDKLRKYVMYTYGVYQLEERSNRPASNNWIADSLHRKTTLRGDSVYLDKATDSVSETTTLPEAAHTQEIQLCVSETTPSPSQSSPRLNNDSGLVGTQKKNSYGSVGEEAPQHFVESAYNNASSLPPVPEFMMETGTDISVLQKNLQSLYDYNRHLMERLAATESLLESLCKKPSLPTNTCPT